MTDNNAVVLQTAKYANGQKTGVFRRQYATGDPNFTTEVIITWSRGPLDAERRRGSVSIALTPFRGGSPDPFAPSVTGNSVCGEADRFSLEEGVKIAGARAIKELRDYWAKNYEATLDFAALEHLSHVFIQVWAELFKVDVRQDFQRYLKTLYPKAKPMEKVTPINRNVPFDCACLCCEVQGKDNAGVGTPRDSRIWNKWIN